MSSGIAGVAVMYGLRLNGMQSSLISNLCNIENMMICVERILQYTTIPSEPSLTIEGNRLDSDWPFKGEIDILNLQVINTNLYGVFSVFLFCLSFRAKDQKVSYGITSIMCLIATFKCVC